MKKIRIPKFSAKKFGTIRIKAKSFRIGRAKK